MCVCVCVLGGAGAEKKIIEGQWRGILFRGSHRIIHCAPTTCQDHWDTDILLFIHSLVHFANGPTNRHFLRGYYTVSQILGWALGIQKETDGSNTEGLSVLQQRQGYEQTIVGD